MLASSLANAKGWDDFTRTLMLAGKSFVPLPAEKRLAETEVEGCESPVWLATSDEQGSLMIFVSLSAGTLLKSVPWKRD